MSKLMLICFFGWKIDWWVQSRLFWSVFVVWIVNSGRNPPTSTWWTLDFEASASAASTVERTQDINVTCYLGTLMSSTCRRPWDDGVWDQKIHIWPLGKQLLWDYFLGIYLVTACNSLKHQLSSRFHKKMGHGSHSFQVRVVLSRFWTYLTLFDLPPRPKACEDTVKYVTHAGLNPVDSGKWICFSWFLQGSEVCFKGRGWLGLTVGILCPVGHPLFKNPGSFDKKLFNLDTDQKKWERRLI